MEIDMTALRMVENEKGVSLETLVDAIEEALLKAYHNLPGAISQARIEIDKKTGRVTVMAMDEDEDGNPIGEFDDTPKNFGRIAHRKPPTPCAQLGRVRRRIRSGWAERTTSTRTAREPPPQSRRGRGNGVWLKSVLRNAHPHHPTPPGRIGN